VRTELPFLLAAVLLHAAVLGARLLVPSSSRAIVPPGAEVRTIDIESLEVPVPPSIPRERSPELPPDPAAPEGAQPPFRPGPRLAGSEPLSGSRDSSMTEPTVPAPEPTANPSTPPRPKPDEYGPLPEDGRGVVQIPGIGGPAVWALPGVVPNAPPPAPAPSTAPSPRPVDKDIAGSVIREAMRASDKHLGLDLPAAGTVASAVGEAVRGSDTPHVSRATFEVRLGPDGSVRSVRIASFSGGAADVWERAAQAAAAILRGRALQMNEAFAKGGTIYVDVSSLLQRPSGSTSAIRPQGLGASFDLSDIGAHAARVVKTSFRAVAMR
jgi:hypothetical protein